MCATWKPTKYSLPGVFTNLQPAHFQTEDCPVSPLVFQIPVKIRSLYRLRTTVITKILHHHTAKFKRKCARQLKLFNSQRIWLPLMKPTRIHSPIKLETQKNLPDILMLRVNNNQLSRHNKTKMQAICQNVIYVSSPHKAIRWSS